MIFKADRQFLAVETSCGCTFRLSRPSLERRELLFTIHPIQYCERCDSSVKSRIRGYDMVTAYYRYQAYLILLNLLRSQYYREDEA